MITDTARQKRKQMLEDPVVPLTLKTALPSLAAMLASGLATLMDALILSPLGRDVTAAVAVSFPLVTLIQTIGFTLGMGAGSLISRCLGRGEQDEARHAASCSLLLALLLGLLLLCAGLLVPLALVRLLGATPAVERDAAVYARYLLLGAPLTCLSLVLSSLLRGQGLVLPNMAAYSLGGAAGVLLQFLLVRRAGLGLLGAGIAMLAREGLTLLLLALAVLRGPAFIRPSLSRCLPTLSILAGIMRSGLPTLIRQGFMSVSGVMVSRVSAGFGEAALAGMGLAVRALALASSAVIGFGQGFQPVCGVNYGARRMDRVRYAYCFCMKTLVFSLLAVGALVFLFAQPLLALFGAEAQATAFAARVLRAQSVVLAAQGAVILMNMLTQAMGLTVRATLVASSRQGPILMALLALMPRLFGETGLVLAQSASDLIALALSYLLTRKLFAEELTQQGLSVRESPGS
ncbi:MAG: MATE family efflux transporter [Clostridia bacterium]|nr:MATE family efflux transporter [Clostridia bacterium]